MLLNIIILLSYIKLILIYNLLNILTIRVKTVILNIDFRVCYLKNAFSIYSIFVHTGLVLRFSGFQFPVLPSWLFSSSAEICLLDALGTLPRFSQVCSG